MADVHESHAGSQPDHAFPEIEGYVRLHEDTRARVIEFRRTLSRALCAHRQVDVERPPAVGNLDDHDGSPVAPTLLRTRRARVRRSPGAASSASRLATMAASARMR